MSIINEKYKGKYGKDHQDDWVAATIKDLCYDAPKKGDGKPEFNANKLFKLAALNKVPKDKIDAAKTQIDTNPGHMRMNIGNALRGAGRRRFGLYDLDGDWMDAPDEFLVNSKGEALDGPAEDHDGVKIKANNDNAAAPAKADKKAAAPKAKAPRKKAA